MKRFSGMTITVALMVVAGSLRVAADRDHDKVSFVQQDKVVTFNVNAGIGLGAQSGTVTGDITGVSLVNFQFVLTPTLDFTFDNRAGITNLSGDQVIFKNVGTGRFIPGLQDPTLATPATPPFQVFAAFPNAIGATFRGTYEVVAVSPGFSQKFHLGDVLQYRAVAYNPSTPPSAPGGLGSVYVEVSDFDRNHDR